MGKSKFATPIKERGVGFMDAEKYLAGFPRLSDPEHVLTKRENTSYRISWPATSICLGVAWIAHTVQYNKDFGPHSGCSGMQDARKGPHHGL